MMLDDAMKWRQITTHQSLYSLRSHMERTRQAAASGFYYSTSHASKPPHYSTILPVPAPSSPALLQSPLSNYLLA